MIDLKSEIRNNIRLYGFHNYLVLPSSYPRYSYTIGLNDDVGFELICGGMCFYDAADLKILFDDIVGQLFNSSITDGIFLTRLGAFRLSIVHDSWVSYAGTGAADFYNNPSLKFCQITSEINCTIDDPDMHLPITHSRNSAWKYLYQTWVYPISPNSEVLVDQDALKGDSISKISRYEVDYWEMFSSTFESFNGGNAKIIPLSVILELYDNLHFCMDMELDTQITL